MAGEYNLVSASKAFTGVTPQPVVTSAPKQGIAAKAAIESITGLGTDQRIVTGTAVEYANEIIAAID